MNRKYNFRERLLRFMSSRNGADRFSYALLILYLVLFVINIFVKSLLISLIIDIIIVFSLFRMFSGNLYKRQRENAWYYRQECKVKSFFRLRKRIFKDRKTHIYRRCPGCKKMVRLPKLKGKHTAVCPSCKTNFKVNVLL